MTFSSHNIWQGLIIKDVWSSWWTNAEPTKTRNLPLLICWEIWIACNRFIFQNISPHLPSISAHILTDYNTIPNDEETPRPRTIVLKAINYLHPWDFFDDSAHESGCGGGAILYLSESHHFHIQMGLGRGTNNFAELITSKYLIQFALEKHCSNSNLQLFGDSKVVCNWINKT